MAVVAIVLLAGCSFDDIASRVNPYRIDVRQGNYVDQGMISSLRKGMTRDQVRFVLGTPLVVDVFRNDRWDYVYLHQPGRGEPEQRVLSVFFVDDLLDSVAGDVVSADQAGADVESESSERARVIEIEPAQPKRRFF